MKGTKQTLKAPRGVQKQHTLFGILGEEPDDLYWYVLPLQTSNTQAYSLVADTARCYLITTIHVGINTGNNIPTSNIESFFL